MSYDLIQKEGQYLSELKETQMIRHIGSGPVEDAPKEKEVKDPEADTKGVGTQQAGTKDSGNIPSIPALKKELAKEDMSLAEELEYALEHCGKDHSKDKENVKEAEEKCPECDMDKKDCKCNHDDKKCAECGKEKCECPKDKEEVKEQDESDVEAPEGAEKEMKDEKEAEGAEAEKEMAEEQMSIKNQARMAGRMDNPPPVAGSPAEKAARASANVPPAAIKPPAVQKMRQPIPPRAVTPGLTHVKTAGGTRPVKMGRL